MSQLLTVTEAAKESWRRAGHGVELTPDLFLRYIREGLFVLHDTPTHCIADPYSANFNKDGTPRQYIRRGFETLIVDQSEFDRVEGIHKAWKAAWAAGERDFEAWKERG